MTSFVNEALNAVRAQGLYRELARERDLIDFTSNDYLGLATDPVIRRSLIDELTAGCPLGATGSPLVSGYTPYHERTEAFLQKTFAAPSALIFSSGFTANLGVIGALGPIEFYSDELNHASLIDGLRLLRTNTRIYRHNDLNHLEELLKKSKSPHRAIVTESVFSQDGDLAPLEELIELGRRFEAWLVIDEAHATGLFGATGLGRLEGRHFEKVIAVHTASKALGGLGAFILSSREVRELIVNRARSFIYSTALAPLSCLQIGHAVRALRSHKRGEGRKLLLAAEEFRRALPWPVPSSSAINPIVLGSNEKVLRASQRLRERGLNVRAMRFPTVARGTERLRVTLKSTLAKSEIETLVSALRELA